MIPSRFSRSFRRPLTGLAVAVGLVAATMAAAFPPTKSVELGDPLPGLTSAQLELFEEGKRAFEEEEGAADGLGPVFNGKSCAECHSGPATGGSSDIISVRFGTTRDGRFDALPEFGGPTIQSQGIVGLDGFAYQGETVPEEATVVARRRANPTFGFGLVDAVPDESFELLAEMQSWLHPETAGRPNFVVNLKTGEPAVGKFGWKAQAATLFDFSADAYKDEMGITTAGLFSSDDGRNVGEENCPQGDCDLLQHNPVESPNEPDEEDLVLFASFMAMLAPPPRGPITRDVREGERVFMRIGCADCHVPTLVTGHHGIKSLSHKTFHPYSDFLLHDMGQLGDGIEQGVATGSEMRTAPLWGLRELPFFLHDGSADTIEEAIEMHDGQALSARNHFLRLRARDRANLLKFLDSL